MKNTNEQIVSYLEMYNSLFEAVQDCGGCPEVICKPEALTKMTVIELISLLATNNVRFVYKPKKETVVYSSESLSKGPFSTYEDHYDNT